ncbi:MAG: polyprenyl synthetase family protein [Phycisphaerae bacterium]
MNPTLTPPRDDAPPTLGRLFAPIEDDLACAQRVFDDELGSDQAFICDLCRHVGQFHGKRLRPALLLLTARACGRLTPAHHTLAAVVEMVHLSTLVHDDILDEADIRRRVATVNRLWGNERAVLMGDFLIAHSFHLCTSLESTFAARLIAHTAGVLCEGEMMQVVNRDNFELSEAEYFDIITRKTASLLGAACLLGARYADADERTTRRMREFGVLLGVAFQITDDLLDLVGDEAETGKSLGRDVHKGKLTLPLIHYLSSAPMAQRVRMMTLLRGEDPQRYRQIASLLADSSSIDYANQTAAARIAEALRILDDLPAGDARDSLSAMAEFVTSRRQ